MKRLCILTLALVCAAATSCIYDFEAEVEGQSGILVVEGDILAGDISVIDLTLSQTLSDKSDAVRVQAQVWVEQQDGTRFSGYRSGERYYVDTRSLDPSQQCRLCVNNTSYGTCRSQWLDILRSPQIGEITNSVTEDGEYMNIYVSTGSSGEGSGYYRWMVSEEWEYVSDYYATHYYDPASGKVLPFEGDDNTHFCWNSGSVSSLMVGSTAKLKQDKLENQYLYNIHNDNIKISYIYAVTVEQRAISEDAYSYWVTVIQNDDGVGGLFSPQPSEMRGNITCDSNPDKPVLGYISASTVTSKRAFFRNKDTGFYKKPKTGEIIEPEEIPEADWNAVYLLDNMRVYTFYETETQVYEDRFTWLPRRCVDCTAMGGTTEKPEDWPL